MRKAHTIKYDFIELLPASVEPETLYVSMKYKNMVHLCLCGCGRRVITPLSPTGWELTFNGREVSVFPSIGNWNLPCRSHYWITRGRVKWAEQWSAERIAANFAHDRADKERYYTRQEQPRVLRDSDELVVTLSEDHRGLWERMKDWFGAVNRRE
jgi:hypothetical protein